MPILDDIYAKVIEIEREIRELPQNLRVIHASQIVTDSLSAITANLGVVMAGVLKSPNYVQGASGFIIEANTGSAEFQNVTVRGSLSSSVLVYNERQSVGGNITVTYSAGKLIADFTTPPALSGTTTIDIEDPPSGHVQLFSTNDVILIQTAGVSAWFTVTGYSDQVTFYRYTIRLESGSTNSVIRKGTGVADFGANTGGGYLEMIAQKTNSEGPYYSVRRHSGSPWSSTIEMVRIGNLKNSYGTGPNNRYGIGVGDYSVGNYLSYNADGADSFVIKAGNGEVTLDGGGIAIELGSAGQNTIAWKTSGVTRAGIFAHLPSANIHTLEISGLAPSNSMSGNVFLTSEGRTSGGVYHYSQVHLYTTADGSDDSASLGPDGEALLVKRTYASFVNDVRIGQGLYVGSTSLDPGDGEVYVVNDGRFGGGLYVGSLATDPAVGEIVGDKISALAIGSSNGVFIGQDTQLYRSSANVLTSPDSFQAATLQATSDGSSGGVYIGTDGQIYRDAANIMRTPDSLMVDGDLYTVARTDYSATSTIVGWSSFTQKAIWYRKIGKLVFVTFYLLGTSDNATTTFTLPFNTASTPVSSSWIQFLTRTQDNTGTYQVGFGYLTYSSNLVTLLKDPAGNAYTGSGTKAVLGQFCYEAA